MIAAPRVTPRADGPVRVLFGQPAFSEEHAWNEVLAHWPDELTRLAERIVIETVPHIPPPSPAATSAMPPATSATPSAATPKGRGQST